MKIWHSTVSAVLFTALLVSGMAWPSDKSRFQRTQFVNSEYSATESQESNAMMMAQDLQNPEESGPTLNQAQSMRQMDGFKGTAVEQNAKKSSGFRHIYQLDMTIPSQCCPDALQLHTSNSLRLCGRKSGATCNSITIPSYGKSYQEVRGIVRAYQFGSPDAFHTTKHGNIDSNYVDGISITHGKSPRKHIWTYAIGFAQYKHNSVYTCPNTGGGRAQPAFVGVDYFCSSANPGNSGQTKGHWAPILYPSPLWSNIRGDCSDCGDDELFFCVKLPRPTTDNLEVRVCTDENLTNNEDIRIEYMDFYIR